MALLVLGACQSGPEPAAPPVEASGEPTEEVSEQELEGSAEVLAVVESETAPVWIGISCLTASPERSFSFYVDGSESQRVDCRCEGEISKDVAPNCGQFVVEVPVGVRTLRIQDDTGDSHAEDEFGITSERWITVTHREVSAGAGFLTSFDEWQTRPRFAITVE